MNLGLTTLVLVIYTCTAWAETYLTRPIEVYTVLGYCRRNLYNHSGERTSLEFSYLTYSISSL